MHEDILKDAVALRKYLHQHPELSCEEKHSSAHIANLLKSDCNPDDLILFDHYGIAAVFNGKRPGKSLLIRGDFDALPIQETNEFAHRTETDGVSHKCGHDGHAAILYALARKLSQQRPKVGQAILLFQPAEENGEGAKGVINDEKFSRLTPDYAVALHNLPGYGQHEIVIRDGTFTAAANSIIIKLTGKTSHAAEPELGLNPGQAMAEITQAILSANVPDLNDDHFRIATPIYTHMGEKSYGLSAGHGELHFTLRAWDNEVIQSFEKHCEQIARSIGEQHGLQVGIKWTESFFANFNNQKVISAVRDTASEYGLQLLERETPFKWGEDFGIFTELFPGAMFGLGAGKDWPALHNPDYDFPDELIETGMNMFYGLIAKLQH